MNNIQKARRVRDIADEISDLVEEASNIARTTDGIFYDGFSTYVFDQIPEHIKKINPYNQDMNDLAEKLENLVEEDCNEFSEVF